MAAALVFVCLGSAAALADTLTGGAPALGPTSAVSERAIALPKILSARDAAAYAGIFKLQEAGRWPEADRAMARLDDKRLLGHVLAQRYLGPNYRTRYHEFEAWLYRYGDHPQAPRIYKLAKKRMPPGAKPPPPPTEQPRGAVLDAAPDLGDDETPSEFADAPAPALDDAETADADMQADAAAELALEDEKTTPSLPPAAQLKPGQAARVWSAGLNHWRKQRFGDAARLFEAVGGAPTDAWMKSAGYFWAARAFHASQLPRRYLETMQLAAQYPRTFYGLLARHSLGLDYGLNFQRPRLSQADLQALVQVPRVQRALALVEARQHDRADHELRAAADSGQANGVALVSLADRISAPAVALDVAGRLLKLEGVAVDAALYPVMPWAQNAGEYTIDSALLHALVRQESGFRVRAISRAGARGLMQLMPATGRFVARAINTPLASRDRLFDPGTNLLLGQAYVDLLFRDETIGPSLFKMAAAYNGGPGNLRKWERRMNNGDDALLFIESIPVRETRIFIERVLTNMWIYRIRFGQPIPSLDTLASGEWPSYDPQNSAGVAEASVVATD